jgi:hypothetical protein
MSSDAIVHVAWIPKEDPKKRNQMSRELKRSLNASLSLWNYPIFIWGLTCAEFKFHLDLDFPCSDIELDDMSQNRMENRECLPLRPRLLPGRIYVSKHDFYKRRKLPEFDGMMMRFVTFEPLLKVGIRRAVYLDVDAFGVRENAIGEILNHSNRHQSGAVFTRRCSFNYADRLNFSHPLVLARSPRDTVNTGVIGFVNLSKWCLNWNRSESQAFELFMSHKDDNKVSYQVLSDQTFASAIFAQQTLKISPMYNFRRISGDHGVKGCRSAPISIEHMHK